MLIAVNEWGIVIPLQYSLNTSSNSVMNSWVKTAATLEDYDACWTMQQRFRAQCGGKTVEEVDDSDV